jgi:hypothetical protein
VPDPSHPWGGGAWTQKPDGSWTWVPGATPDPNLVKQYGNGALTDVRRDPNGNLNHGAWVRNGRRGWAWIWNADPDPNLVKKYGKDKLTNPNQDPAGAQGPGDPNNWEHPLPPDVVPPTVADIWGGVAPDVTGQLPPPPDGSPGAVDKPPSHRAYLVSPGSIRNAENTLLARTDAQISQYNDLKAYVEQTRSQNIYYDDSGVTEGQLSTTQDRLLQNIADAVELYGQYISMLNYAAQNYAHADVGSFIWESLQVTQNHK